MPGFYHLFRSLQALVGFLSCGFGGDLVWCGGSFPSWWDGQLQYKLFCSSGFNIEKLLFSGLSMYPFHTQQKRKSFLFLSLMTAVNVRQWQIWEFSL